MSSPGRKRSDIRPWSVVLLLFAVIGIYYFLPQLGEFNGIIGQLGNLDWLWLGIAIVVMAASFVVATHIQFIAGARRGNQRELFRVTLRGSFMNHFLPFSIGTITLMSRYYTHFVSRTQAALIASLPTIGSVLVSALLLAVVSPVTLSHISTRLGNNAGDWLVPVGLLTIIAGLTLALLYWRHVRHFMNHVAAELSDSANVKRFGLVLAYSLLLVIIYAAVLWASAFAAHAPISYLEAVALYIVVWAVGNIVPTPGGIGTTEATLTFGAVSLGANLATAATTMLVFRFVSFWLPLVPGIVAMTDRKRFRYSDN